MQRTITFVQTIAGIILARTNVGGDLSDHPLPSSGTTTPRSE
jgi:hypothetical protein